MRGQQRWKNAVDKAYDRLRESDKPKPTPEEKRVQTINNLLSAYEKLENPNKKLANKDQKKELLDRCEAFCERAEDATTGNDPDYTYEGNASYPPPHEADVGIYINEKGVEHAIPW